MSFAVQKNPIKVIEIKDGDNINNYPEFTNDPNRGYRKLETVPMQYTYPMGVKTYTNTPIEDKYLMWQGGDANNGALVENLNKTMVDNALLAEAKAAKYLKIRKAAEKEVGDILTASNIEKDYILSYMFLRTFTDSTQEWFTAEQILELKTILEASFVKLQAKFAEITAANSTNISAIVWQ